MYITLEDKIIKIILFKKHVAISKQQIINLVILIFPQKHT
jgi:hypothetical protein